MTTPSPTATAHFSYPFACRRPARSPSSGEVTVSSGASEPAFPKQMKTLPSRVRELNGFRGPVSRSSNPMLAATFRESSEAIEGCPESEANKCKSGRLDRDYDIIQSLGRGEFSQVWKVREKNNGRLWAIKAGKPYTGYKNR